MLWHTDKYQNIEELDQVFYVPEIEAFGIITDKALSMVEAKTGNELWTNDKWNSPVATYFIDKDENTMTLINIPRTFLGSLFKGFKNQIMKLNSKTGEVIWENTYIGTAQKKVITGQRVVV